MMANEIIGAVGKSSVGKRRCAHQTVALLAEIPEINSSHGQTYFLSYFWWTSNFLHFQWTSYLGHAFAFPAFQLIVLFFSWYIAPSAPAAVCIFITDLWLLPWLDFHLITAWNYLFTNYASTWSLTATFATTPWLAYLLLGDPKGCYLALSCS